MTRTFVPHGGVTRGACRRLAPSLLIVVALLGCQAKPPVIPQKHFEELRGLADELDDAHQSLAESNRGAYRRLVAAQGQARLDSEHAGCAMRIMATANARLQSCEATVVAAHMECSADSHREFRKNIARYEARRIVGEGDVYRHNLEAEKLLASMEESASELSTAMQVGANYLRGEMAALLAAWGTERLENRRRYEQKVGQLFQEFEEGEGKGLRRLLDTHRAFHGKVDEIEDLATPPPAGHGAAVGEDAPQPLRRRAWMLEDRLRHHVEKGIGDLLQGELLALRQRCREDEKRIRHLSCAQQSACEPCAGRTACNASKQGKSERRSEFEE